MQHTGNLCAWTWHTKDKTGKVNSLVCSTHDSVVMQSTIDLSLVCEKRVDLMEETIAHLKNEIKTANALL